MTPAQLQTQRILWGALFSSTFMYLVVAGIVQAPVGEEAPPAFLPLVLAATALGLAAASVVLPERNARAALLGLALPVVTLAPEDTMFEDQPRRKRRFADPEAARRSAAATAQVAFILGLALAEAVAIHGFLLLYLRFGLAWGLPFFVVAWGLMLRRFPTPRGLDALLEGAYDAELAAVPGRIEGHR